MIIRQSDSEPVVENAYRVCEIYPVLLRVRNCLVGVSFELHLSIVCTNVHTCQVSPASKLGCVGMTAKVLGDCRGRSRALAMSCNCARLPVCVIPPKLSSLST